MKKRLYSASVEVGNQEEPRLFLVMAETFGVAEDVIIKRLNVKYGALSETGLIDYVIRSIELTDIEGEFLTE